jgi:hypothetical protein
LETRVSANESNAPQASDLHRQVDRILGSPAFSGSEASRHLLSFLVDRSLSNPERHVKEYEIATEVMGRPADFDPRIDSVVRVQIARLRSKLAEYYVGGGKEDEILIEIPKGGHQLRGAWRQSPVPACIPAAEVPAPVRSDRASRGHLLLIAAAIVVFSAVFLVLAIRNWGNSPERAFWRTFLDSSQEPVLVFSNPRFAGSSNTSLHYFREGEDAPEALDDTYTGTGEVMAVQQLTRKFTTFNRSFRVKRAQLLTWDDARDNELIIVGSPEQNLALTRMSPLEEFRFKPYDAEPRIGYGAVVNLQPGPGEEKYYFASTARPIRYDYAIIALVSSINSSRQALVLAGTTTYGTQAAGEFVCNPERVKELIKRLGVPPRGRIPPFEAVLYVQITGGVPTDTYLQVVRRRRAVGDHEKVVPAELPGPPEDRPPSLTPSQGRR